MVPPTCWSKFSFSVTLDMPSGAPRVKSKRKKSKGGFQTGMYDGDTASTVDEEAWLRSDDSDYADEVFEAADPTKKEKTKEKPPKAKPSKKKPKKPKPGKPKPKKGKVSESDDKADEVGRLPQVVSLYYPTPPNSVSNLRR